MIFNVRGKFATLIFKWLKFDLWDILIIKIFGKKIDSFPS